MLLRLPEPDKATSCERCGHALEASLLEPSGRLVKAVTPKTPVLRWVQRSLSLRVTPQGRKGGDHSTFFLHHNTSRHQRHSGSESKNARCTYQMLSGSPFARSAGTRGKRLFLVVSPATQQLTPSAERTPARGDATRSAVALRSPRGRSMARCPRGPPGF